MRPALVTGGFGAPFPRDAGRTTTSALSIAAADVGAAATKEAKPTPRSAPMSAKVVTAAREGYGRSKAGCGSEVGHIRG